MNRRKKPNSLPPADTSASAKPDATAPDFKKWRPSDLGGHPCVLPHDCLLAHPAALATLEVRKGEWIGVYQGDSLPDGELLWASHSPRALCRKLKQRPAVVWPVWVRLAGTKEELSAPLAQSPEQRPHDWQEELRRVRNLGVIQRGSMDDCLGVMKYGDGDAWEAVIQLAQTNDAIDKENRINSLWRMHPQAAEKLDPPKSLASSLSQVDAAKKEPAHNAPRPAVELTQREKKILGVETAAQPSAVVGTPQGFGGLGQKKTGPEVAKDSTGNIGPRTKRGPKANMKFHHDVADAVNSFGFGKQWKELSNLEQIAGKLSKQKMTPAPSAWAKRERPARSWTRAVEYYPEVVVKALDYSLKMAAKDTTGKPSLTLANLR